ncbi:Cytochrome c biogenesis ATP-binding export protein CcmA [Thalassocella blandensis]|nr:Cytochrome c biogenesis ATP-binding export protein CcmA [Thalassocella blandensis]
MLQINLGWSEALAVSLKLSNVQCEIEDRVLFSDLNYTLEPGTITHLVGPNGAGKTTLLRIITGLFDHYDGDVLWDDQPAGDYDFLSSLLYIGHATGVKSSLTPLENLQWYFALHGKKQAGSQARGCTPDKQALSEALTRVQLGGYDDVPCYQLSAGQQRRVALARLFVSCAPIWVLDEPFTAIDKQGVAQLEARLIEHAQNGGIVLLTTHQPPHFSQLKVLDLADYAVNAKVLA